MLTNFCLNKNTFKKKKTGFLLLTEFFKKILLFISVKKISLIIKGVPSFLKEILFCFFTKLNKFYKHPFKNNIIFEKNLLNYFFFTNIIFLNNNYKMYNNLKKKKIGRLKRKIFKKILIINNIFD